MPKSYQWDSFILITLENPLRLNIYYNINITFRYKCGNTFFIIMNDNVVVFFTWLHCKQTMVAVPLSSTGWHNHKHVRLVHHGNKHRRKHELQFISSA